MADERAIARYRRWYRKLVRLYPRLYRERFAESMEQTFGDLCRERATAGQGLFGFFLWTFVETSAGILRENMALIMTHRLPRRLTAWAAGVAALLLVPLWGNHYVEGWNWGPFDFVFAWALLFGAGLAYELIASRGGTLAYRAAVGIGCATGLVLLWINAAVGIIGDGPINLLYLGVLAVGFAGALIARFGARGMSRALFSTAVAQMLVPLIALVIWKAGGQDLLTDPNSPHSPFHPGIAPVFALNAVFAALWVGSALLFRQAAAPTSEISGDEQRHVAR